MAFERLVGLHVTDNEKYDAYRAAMKPILKNFGGALGYDFTINQTLKSEVQEEINRVFTIVFPSESEGEKFFKDPTYLKIKDQHFAPAVKSTTIMRSYLT